ncbi:MAG: type I DNA topoisomerase [Roseitalea porphyridii]|jgi:DNA topoisomerase-1|uniref:type I DNA topoisomerase n=1 Tax=Roseitalea porphyridii TaxID=1852022 RepID=UPI0032EC4962
MEVVVVESPAKAKTINKYLGSGYKVLASFGHVRDLPPKDGSVKPEDDFAMSWQVDTASNKRLNEIASAVKSADGLILATDPDREGEAISWHVLEVLNKKKALKDKPVKRVVFNAITKNAVLDAIAHPRDIDGPLVDAYLARRALDYLVGFTLSPVLWRKLPGARSAGRVQSVALRLVCDRETEIEQFKPEEYWSILAQLKTAAEAPFTARLTGFDGKKLTKMGVKDGDTAGAIKAMLEAASFKVANVEAKPVKRNPPPPFTTSTLQQAASAKLGFAPARTMQIAQKLYEGVDLGSETAGLITYMRTDGVQMAPEAIDSARSAIGERFGDRFVPEKPRFYSSKAKNAQEAHEAVRPTDFTRAPDAIRSMLTDEQFKLYDLIWKRGIASQMEQARLERTTVDIVADGNGKRAELRATGSVVTFEGFFAAYTEHRDDQKADDEDGDDNRLPPMAEGETCAREAIEANQHFTEPPPRFTEASLIKKMEEIGIGRPSTYSATVSTLKDRDYVRLDKRALVPEPKGRLVTAFLQDFFERYVEYDFTADLEEKLDLISDGKLAWKDVLRDFWRDFSAHVDETKELRIANVLDALNERLEPLVFPKREDGSDPRICPKCGTGQLSLKLGKFGSFVGCSNYPDCSYTRQLGQEGNGEADAFADGPQVLGKDPFTGEEITLRTGRFGPYVQRGEGKEAKRTSVPKGWKPEEIDHEKALALLSLPRDVGAHPETGKMISAGLGRYGPFVLHDGTYANLESVEEVFSVGLNRAVTLIAEKKAKGGARGRGAAALKELGEHPEVGGPVTVHDGRYGPYVKHGKINATIPKGTDPMSVDLPKAVELIAARAEKAGKKVAGPSGAKKKATGKKKAAPKKATGKGKAAASASADE